MSELKHVIADCMGDCDYYPNGDLYYCKDVDPELTRLQEKVAQLEGENAQLRKNDDEYFAKCKILTINNINLHAECERLQQQLVELDHCREEAGKAEDIAKECERLRPDARRLDYLLRNVCYKEFRRLGIFYSGNKMREDIDAQLEIELKAQLAKEQPHE